MSGRPLYDVTLLHHQFKVTLLLLNSTSTMLITGLEPELIRRRFVDWAAHMFIGI